MFTSLAGLQDGQKYELRRRSWTTWSVMPFSSKRKCACGSSNGEFRMEFSMTVCSRASVARGAVAFDICRSEGVRLLER